jgi:hypothetical protein
MPIEKKRKESLDSSSKDNIEELFLGSQHFHAMMKY